MVTTTDPSFDDLAIFLAVCRAGGFRSAARQLGMSPAHVSATIATARKGKEEKLRPQRLDAPGVPCLLA